VPAADGKVGRRFAGSRRPFSTCLDPRPCSAVGLVLRYGLVFKDNHKLTDLPRLKGFHVLLMTRQAGRGRKHLIHCAETSIEHRNSGGNAPIAKGQVMSLTKGYANYNLVWYQIHCQRLLRHPTTSKLTPLGVSTRAEDSEPCSILYPPATAVLGDHSSSASNIAVPRAKRLSTRVLTAPGFAIISNGGAKDGRPVLYVVLATIRPETPCPPSLRASTKARLRAFELVLQMAEAKTE